MTVADLGGDGDGRVERRDRNQVHLLGPEPVGLDLGGPAHHQGVAPRVERRDIERSRPGQPEPTPLTDRVVGEAPMRAEHAALPVDDAARTKRPGMRSAQESAVVVVRE